jgi:hypothetical protein
MFNFLGFMQLLAYAAIVAFALYFFGQKYIAWLNENAPKLEHERRKRRLGRLESIAPEKDDKDYVEPSEAVRQNISFGGVPSIRAGNVIMALPLVDPNDPKASKNDRTVLAVARAVAYPAQGKQTYDLVFTDGGQMTGIVGGKPCVFSQLDLTKSEVGKIEERVEKERQEAVDRGDLEMKDLLGDKRNWTIKWAMGANPDIDPGEHECSYIQVLSLHKDLGGKDGFHLKIADALLDGEEHDYYDVLATNYVDDQIFYAFYAGMNGWHLFLGRRLTDDEANQISVS